MEQRCGNLPDIQRKMDSAENDYRKIFDAQDVNDALALSRKSFEQQFADPLRQKFTGFDFDILLRITQAGCDSVANPELIRNLQAEFTTR